MEDEPRSELPGEDDPLDLFDSEGESDYSERDFEPRTASSPGYGTTQHSASADADALRTPAPHALHPSLAQERARVAVSPWMVITGAAAVVVTLISVPLLLSRASDDPSNLSSPSVEPDRSPASHVPRVPETSLSARENDGRRAEDAPRADSRDDTSVPQAARARSPETAAREVGAPAAREVTTPAVDQRSGDAAVAASRVPSVTPTLLRPETASTSPSTSPPSSTVAASSAPIPPADASPPPASTSPPASASTPTASSTLPSGPAPAAVAERPVTVVSSEVARTPPPTAAPPTAVVPRNTLIQNVLDQYRQAFNALDPMAARAVWPSADVKGLGQAFKGLQEQNLQFDNCKINPPVGATATASCVGSVVYVPKVGGRGEVKVKQQWEFKLSEKNDSWLIDRVVTR